MLGYNVHRLESTSNWLVLLHGFGGSSKIWYKQILEYKKYFNILEIDLPSHGSCHTKLSDLKHYTFEDMAHDILKLMNKFKIYKAHFVGISLGTVLANQISLIAPSRVSSMVLGGAVTSFSLKAKFLLKLGTLLKPLLPMKFMYNFFAWILMPKRNHQKSRNIFSREAEKLSKREFNSWFNLIKTMDHIHNLSKLKAKGIPKLYIMGSEDHVFLRSVIKDISGVDDVLLKVIQDCGHICNIEKADDFNNISINFLLEHSRYHKDLRGEFVG